MDTIKRLQAANARIAAEVTATRAVAKGDYGIAHEGAGAFLYMKLDLIGRLAALGRDTADEREAGNCLQIILEELPLAVAYAEKAGLKPDFGGSGVHIKLDMIRGYANEGIDGQDYSEIASGLRF